MNTPIAQHVDSLDWPVLQVELHNYGYTVAKGLLSAEDCTDLAAMFKEDAAFRKHVVMQEHGYGRGEYKYWAYPLPELVASLREALYSRLAGVANVWSALMKTGIPYPATHREYLERCHAAGQTRPTPLLLQYETGDFNALHQDVYGENLFPIQVAFLLSRPGVDFTGGEFVLTEERSRQETKAEVVNLQQGDGVIFAVRNRPVKRTRGWGRVNLRHGVSRVRSGRRNTMGIIFHDAK